MIAVVQRVSHAAVRVGDRTLGEIEAGLLALVAIVRDDTDSDVRWMAQKLTGLRIFPNGDKHFDLSVSDVPGGGILVVSNFTVAAETEQGRRPSLSAAATSERAEKIFGALIQAVRQTGVRMATGEFGGDMRVSSTNVGPATFIVDSAGSRDAALT